MWEGEVAPPTQRVSCVTVLGNVVEWHWCHCVILTLSRLCCDSGIVCDLSLGFWWSVKFSLGMGILEELDGAIVGVSCHGPA